ncbi:MAG: hypothetical protein V3T72_11815 [Thermoanaerobaculia bacterium]
MDEIHPHSAWDLACRHVAAFVFEGIEFKMRGDKNLVDVKIPPELIRRSSPEELENTLQRGINLARVVADFEAAMLYSKLSGVAEILEEAPDDIELAPEIDERSRGAPELVAGINVLLKSKAWSHENVARRSGIPEYIVKEILLFRYSPFGAMRGEATLTAVIDLARPIAAAFGVTPQVLWNKGRARIHRLQRQKRLQIKRVLRAARLHRKGRKPNPAQLARLRLGKLAPSDVMADIELEATIKTEVLWDRRRGVRPFMRWPNSPERAPDDYGPLLLGNAGALRESVAPDDYKKLKELDRKAHKDPASVTEDELAWVRELLGLPDLGIAEPAAEESTRER